MRSLSSTQQPILLPFLFLRTRLMDKYPPIGGDDVVHNSYCSGVFQ